METHEIFNGIGGRLLAEKSQATSKGSKFAGEKCPTMTVSSESYHLMAQHFLSSGPRLYVLTGLAIAWFASKVV